MVSVGYDRIRFLKPVYFGDLTQIRLLRGSLTQKQFADLVEIGYLAQLLGNPDLVVIVFHGRQGLARDLHVLVVIHREVLAVAGTGAQRRHTQHVGNVLKLLPIPGEDHGA